MTVDTGERGILRREARVLGLIGVGHMLNHMYFLALPPLFPIIHRELGLSYTELGISMTAQAVAMGVLQTPMGFLCQRLGSRVVLICGLFVNAGAIALVGFATDLWVFAALMFLAGAGGAVFHPADYGILSGSIAPKRVGRAFAIHNLGGTIGFALAPVVMVALATVFDWRMALLLAGGAGVLLSFVILAFSGVFSDGEGRKSEQRRSGWRDLLGSRPILLFMVFYIGAAAANAGVAQFGVVAMTDFYGVDLALANAALSAYLIASAVAVLPGGWLADRTTHHNLVLGGMIAVAVIGLALVGSGIAPFWLVIVLLGITGASRGLVNATRDVLVRHLAGDLHVGTVFAFVSTGFLIGVAISPAIYGALIDIGSPSIVFWASAGFSLVCALTALAPMLTPKPGAAGGQAAE